MALEEIKSQLCGKWKLDRSENFDEFLKELGKFLFMFFVLLKYILILFTTLINKLDSYFIYT